MKPFFTDGPAEDEIYTFNRDSEHRDDLRERIEAMWRVYAPFCGDAHFLSDARAHFHSRTWELVLAAHLLHHGHNLDRADSDGPDIKVVSSTGAYWFEAVAPTAGTGPDAAHRVIGMRRETEVGLQMTFRINHNSKVLRYTSVLNEKRKQHQQFLERARVGASEPYIVAINGGAIDDADLEIGLPDVVRAVLPIDEPVYRVPIDSDEPPRTEWPYRDSVAKAGGASVATTAFLSGEYAAISAVLFHPRGVWNIDNLRGDSMVLIHNPYARNRLPMGTLAFGREYWVSLDDSLLRWEDHRQVVV